MGGKSEYYLWRERILSCHIYVPHTRVPNTLYNHNKYKSLKSNLFSGHSPSKVYLIFKAYLAALVGARIKSEKHTEK